MEHVVARGKWWERKWFSSTTALHDECLSSQSYAFPPSVVLSATE